MEYAVKEKTSGLLVTLQGNLTKEENIKGFVHLISKSMNTPIKYIILDFNAVDTINSRFLGAAMDMYQAAKSHGIRINIICTNNSECKEILVTAFFNQIMPFIEHEEEAE